MRKQQRLPSGFSLLEMMVVLAIVAIIASIATVGWSHWQANSKRRFSKDRLIASLNARRLLAINEHLSYKCKLNHTQLTCQRWTFDKKGYIGWHNHQTNRVIDPSLHMKIAKSTPPQSHALYFLSSGEIPFFLLEVSDHKKILYRLTSTGTHVVEAGTEI